MRVALDDGAMVPMLERRASAEAAALALWEIGEVAGDKVRAALIFRIVGAGLAMRNAGRRP